MKKKRIETTMYSWSCFGIAGVMVVLSIFFLMIIPNGAHATEFSVSNVTELIEAIHSANDEIENPGADTINLTPGIYLLTEVDNENDGPNGLPSITSRITINGNLSTIERSNGGEIPELRIFHVHNTGNLTLKELSISNGKIPEGISGGGLYSKGVLTLSSCNVSGNQAGDGSDGENSYDDGGFGADGGGLFNHSGEITIENCTLSGNIAGNGGDGGRYGHGGDGGRGGGFFNHAGDVSIKNSTFSNNQTGNGGHGGSYYDLSVGGSGGRGGGFFNHTGEISIKGSIFSGNLTGAGGYGEWARGSGGSGGGLYNLEGVAVIDNSIFSKNQLGHRSAWGGGIYNGGSMIITNNTIYENNAGDFGSGGGIGNSATMTITNSTITDNRKGGIQNSGPLSIKSSTITHNWDKLVGGGIESTQYEWLVSVQNTIIALNSAYNYDNCNRGAVESKGHNLIGREWECGMDYDIGDIFAANPMLGSLSDNGGPTPTHALLLGSPAIDNGDQAECPKADQRGFLRPVDGDTDGKAICDIGSYEVQRCKGNYNEDSDVDGDDLATQAGVGIGVSISSDGVSLEDFAEHFGRNNCPH